MIDVERLKAGLRKREGVRPRPYVDTRGQVTIGVGHNLTAHGLTARAIEFVLDEDVIEATGELDRWLPWWQELDDVRGRVLAELAFNMGVGTLLGFNRMLRHLRLGEFAAAADELGLSAWARQVDDGIGGRVGRADVLCAMLRHGRDT